MKNWKTTISGIAGALGIYLTNSSDPKIHLLGMILTGASLLLTGASAKDSNVTGGTKPQTGEAVKRLEKEATA